MRLICFLSFVLISHSNFSQDTLRNIENYSQLVSYKDYNSSQQFCGYIIGQSCSKYEFFAERYDISDSAKVVKIISYHAGNIQNITRKVNFEIYSVGDDKMPLTLLNSREETYRNLIFYGNPVITEFFEPVKVGKSFFVALNFLDYAHYPLTDTIAILSSLDGTRPDSDLNTIGRNVLRVHHYDFEDLYTKTGLKINLALFPVIEFPIINSTKENFVSNGNFIFYAPFPNPCLNDLTISYKLTLQTEVSISILDLNGKEILSKNLGNKSIGLHNDSLNVTSLPNGSYTLILHSMGSHLGTKFIKSF